MPVAGQVPGTGASASTGTANNRIPSGAVAVTRAWVHERAPEQYRFVPCSRHPPPWRAASSLGPGGWAAHTPHRLPGGGAGPSSSARIATASAWPSASLPSDRSSAARFANAAHRSRVCPEPGSGRSRRPESTAVRNAWPVTCQAGVPRWPPEPSSGTIGAEQVEDVVGVLFLLGQDVLNQPPGGHVGVAEPPDDLLVRGDHDALGGEVLLEHALQVVVGERLVGGMRAGGQRGRIEVGVAAKLADPLGDPHRMAPFLLTAAPPGSFVEGDVHVCVRRPRLPYPPGPAPQVPLGVAGP